MNRFIKKTILLLLPLIIWGVFIYLIDPFNYFGLSLIDNKNKTTAKTINTLLYKTLAYVNNPSENLFIGDSRTNALSTNQIEELTGIEYKKLDTNAAKLNEIFDLFYLANSRLPVKRVVIGINFNMFNKYGYQNRVTGVEQMLKNPLMYLYNIDVAEAAVLTLKSLWFKKETSHKPQMTREEFWQWNLNVKATHWYGKYKFPDELHDQLLAFDKFTSEKGIQAVFIIVPHHISFHNRLREFGLLAQEKRFKDIMAGLNARVFDFDFDNAITRKKENYKDPLHYRSRIGRLIINEIWTDNLTIGKEL